MQGMVSRDVRLELDVGGLDLAVGFQRIGAVLAAETGLLDPAKWQSGGQDIIGVDPDIATFKV